MPPTLGWLLLDSNEISVVDDLIPISLLQLSVSSNQIMRITSMLSGMRLRILDLSDN